MTTENTDHADSASVSTDGLAVCAKCGGSKPCLECKREANRQRNKRYRESNRAKITKRQREWARKNCGDRHLTRNPDQMRSYRAEWEKKNRDAAHQMKLDYQRSAIESLTPAYLAATLRMPLATIPLELLAMKRAHLLVLRATRELIKVIKEKQL